MLCFLLGSATERNDGGAYDWDADAVADLLNCETAEIDRGYAEIQASGMLSEDRIAKWSSRQYESDKAFTNAERQRRRRQRQAQAAAPPAHSPARRNGWAEIYRRAHGLGECANAIAFENPEAGAADAVAGRVAVSISRLFLALASSTEDGVDARTRALVYADVLGDLPPFAVQQAVDNYVRGLVGARSGLWRECARIVGELRPRYLVGENSAHLVHRGLDRVLADLAALGYDAEWSVVSACALGFPHTRERMFVVAYAAGERRE